MEEIRLALLLMGYGLLGVFATLFLIFLAIKLLTRFTR